ncbi:TolC family outer membrane protein (plasmid) [Bradyrhizobium sp. ISRA443]|uniref:TolC family outer membrane protein n=1 Tax=unclassified Bradyrhizobium TaxID=2631580 RepID=UPI002479080C|nr:MULTISPECIES: TolC family outer membrane protein [unclassified Bradyrhizobium]WGS03122.1 TolC family outer membrane protein [Bradyrhizobium sp. ISRA436]WGS10084.1 TolC family outer membrane protein [Bradyrhizobium sp. ISRA437]WGS16969.1 TolC family outer membrane protein [Bradyrhizobium sp. ISRA443]
MKSGLKVSILLVLMLSGHPSASAETLEGALGRAYENNPQLNAERAAVRQADENVAQALSGYRPTISGTATLGTQYTDTTVVVPQPDATPSGPSRNSAGANQTATFRGRTTPRGGSLNVSQNLFDGYQTGNRTRAADVQVLAARESMRAVEQSVLLSAVIAYMDYLKDAALVKVQESNVRVLARTLTDGRGRFKNGDITRTQLWQIEAQLASGEASLHEARASLMAAEANYRRMIGVDPSDLSAGKPADHFLPDSLQVALEQSLTRNPMVGAASYGVDVAVLQIRIAEGGLFPTLVLQGSVQAFEDQNILTPRLFAGTVALGLTLPLYQGGKEYSAIRQKKEAAVQQRFSLDEVRDQVRANVTQFWGQLDASRSRTEAAERQVRAAESALDGVNGEARAGQATTLDVLNAQQALVTARISLVSAQRDRVVTSYNLLAAVGGLSAAALNLPVQVYDPSVHYHQVRDSWFGLRTTSGQ